MSYRGGPVPVIALKSIDFAVMPGEIVAVVGPSGCGKSTLLRCILGLVQPTTGSVLIDGVAPDVARKRGTIGAVFQDTALVEWATVRHNIALPLHFRSVRKRNTAHKEVDTVLEMTGLVAFAEFKPNALSGGMKQRVSIARALAANPTLVLCDEPLGALDVLTRMRVTVDLSKWLRERHVTSVIVTHSVDEAVFLADRVCIMSSRPGCIIEERPIQPWPERNESLFESTEFLAVAAELRHSLMRAWTNA